MVKTESLHEIEKSIEKSSKKLSWVLDILTLALEEMNKSFSSILNSVNWYNKNYLITKELEKFEKKWN